METNKKHIEHKIKGIKAFVLDMDGTIYLGNQLFPYTKAFLDKVQQTKRRYYFFTNNSSNDIVAYMRKLSNFGIHIHENQLMVSTHVLLCYMETYCDKKSVYIVGTPALRREFAKRGWQWNEMDPDIVIVAFDTTLTYEKIEAACRFIRNGATYYGVNPDVNCPMENNTFLPDCGSIAKLIEASTGYLPEFFGKPSKRTLAYIIEKTGCQPNEIAMIGDRLYTDIAVTHNSDVTSILVMSGETTVNDLDKSVLKPDIIIDNIGVLVDIL